MDATSPHEAPRGRSGRATPAHPYQHPGVLAVCHGANPAPVGRTLRLVQDPTHTLRSPVPVLHSVLVALELRARRKPWLRLRLSRCLLLR
jgi:hypothetical protein